MNGFDFRTFWRKYRNLILGGLFFFLIINFCNRQAPPPPESSPVEMREKADVPLADSNGMTLKSYDELMRERALQQRERPNPLIVTLILLIVGVVIVWQYQNRWKDKWFPGKVHFKAVRLRDKITGRRSLRLSLANRSKESLTFMPPLIVFKRWGTVRQFKLKGSDSDNMFPLTLTPGTSHNIVVDLDRFFEKLPELKNFNRVGGSVSTSGGVEYRSFTPPLWLGF